MTDRLFLFLIAVLILLAFAFSCGDDDDDDSGAHVDDDDVTDDDDNTSDDDTVDDDDDDATLPQGDCSDGISYGDLFIQRAIGGDPGDRGTAIASSSDSARFIAANKGHGLVLYREYEPGTWTTQCIDYFGSHPLIRIDSAGAMHILYRNSLSGRLRYGTYFEGDWDFEDAGVSVSPGSANMALDNDSALHFVYFDNAGMTVQYGTNQGGRWTYQTVAEVIIKPLTSYSLNPDVAIGPDGTVHIAYVSNGELIHTHNGTGDWWHETITNRGENPSIEVGDDGTVHLVFDKYIWRLGFYLLPTWYYPLPKLKPSLEYWNNEGDVWSRKYNSRSINNTSRPAMVLDESGAVHFVRSNSGLGSKVRVATNNSGAFTGETAARGENFRQHSIAVTDGKAHLAYSVTSAGTNRAQPGYLAFNTKFNGAWTEAAVATEEFNPYDDRLIIRVDDTNAPMIFFRDTEHNEVFAASESKNGWSAELLDTNNLNDFFSADVDAAGDYHLAYTATGNNVLFYTSGSSGTDSVDTDTNGLKYPDIAVDDSGFAHIVYRHKTSGVKYTTNSGGSWASEVITGYPGASWKDLSAITVDALGNAHVLMAFGNNTLTYATNETGAWVTEDMVSGQRTGDFAIDSKQAGQAHAVYALPESDQLVYTQLPSGQQYIVDDYAGPCAIVADGQENAHIIYQGQGFTYATNSGGSWSKAMITHETNGPVSLMIDDDQMLHTAWFAAGSVYYAYFPAGYSVK